MSVKEKKLSFNNVLCISNSIRNDEITDTANELKRFIISHGLYPTGPLFYQKIQKDQEEESEFRLFMPINTVVQIQGNSKLQFISSISFANCIYVRKADSDDPMEESYENIREYARINNKTITEDFYHVILDAYGEQIVDIYAPVEVE